jgi:O-acetyl-ADP-ribose deacetylase (regulator of RNase III)
VFGPQQALKFHYAQSMVHNGVRFGVEHAFVEAMMMQIILTALDQQLFDAWSDVCGDLPCVETYRGSILDVSCDAVVSPANSFGFMDGGIDAAYKQHFKQDIEMSVRRAIWNEFHGELPVGCAVTVETVDASIPYLIAAPTMRVPMRLGPDTVNPYLAARAALIAARLHPNIKAVAFPGMGTGIGRVTGKLCAMQVRAAINAIFLEENRMPQSWAEASESHQFLYGASPRDLQQ